MSGIRKRNSHLILTRSYDDLNFPTHGFVQVGEPQTDEGDYLLVKRSCSSGADNTNETLFALYRNLYKDMVALETELTKLKRKEVINDRWDKRYSRRISVFANMLLGIWIFWFHFVKFLKKRRGSMKTAVLQIMSNDAILKGLLIDGFKAGFRNSIAFFIFAFLLTRPVIWARYLGIALSSCWSLSLALYLRFLPWTNFFNILCNLLYVSAVYKRQDPLPSIFDYVGRPHTRTAMHSLHTASIGSDEL